MEAMVIVVVSRRASCVLVRGWPARKLVNARARMHRVVLPMPVAASDEEIVRQVFGEPCAHFVALVLERTVGVIVLFVRPVGADDGRRAHQHLPVRVTR